MLTHKFVSPKANGPDATKVRPSNWNDEHAFTGGATGNVLVRNTGDANGATWQSKSSLDVRDYGAVGNGVADDRAAIQAAIDAASAAGGGVVFLPTATYMVAADLTVPTKVSLAGAPLTTLKATATGSFTRALLICGEYVAGGAAFPNSGTGNRYGRVDNLYIDGNSVAPIGLYVGGAVQRTFLNVDVLHCTAQGVVVDGAQNCTFIALHSEKNGSNPSGTYDANLLIDRGAGNNLFLGAELSADTSGTQGAYNLLVRQSGTGPSGTFTTPSYNRFVGGVIERATTGFVAAIGIRAGLNNTFVGVDIQTTGTRDCVLVNGADGNAYLNRWVDCTFHGTAGQSTAFRGAGAFSQMFVNPFLENFTTGFVLDDTSSVYVSGRLHEGSVTTRASASGTGPIGKLWFYDSGEWTTPTFAAGSFTASGSMTWTVAAGDVITQQYKIDRKTMRVRVTLNTTTIGGTVSNILKIAIPAGMVAAKDAFHPLALIIDNSTKTTGYAYVSASGTVINIQRTDGANFALATDTTYIYGDIEFEVQ